MQYILPVEKQSEALGTGCEPARLFPKPRSDPGGGGPELGAHDPVGDHHEDGGQDREAVAEEGVADVALTISLFAHTDGPPAITGGGKYSVA